MEVQVNWIAIIVATLVNLVIGGIWYAPKVFGDSWSKIVGLKEEEMKKDAPKAMAGALAMGFILAFVLAHVSYVAAEYFNSSLTMSALNSAFWLWLGVGFTTFVTQGLFERRPLKWTLITSSNLLVTMLAMAWVIGLFGV
jgi:hypothetical protein